MIKVTFFGHDVVRRRRQAEDLAKQDIFVGEIAESAQGQALGNATSDLQDILLHHLPPPLYSPVQTAVSRGTCTGPGSQGGVEAAHGGSAPPQCSKFGAVAHGGVTPLGSTGFTQTFAVLECVGRLPAPT